MRSYGVGCAWYPRTKLTRSPCSELATYAAVNQVHGGLLDWLSVPHTAKPLQREE